MIWIVVLLQIVHTFHFLSSRIKKKIIVDKLLFPFKIYSGGVQTFALQLNKQYIQNMKF